MVNCLADYLYDADDDPFNECWDEWADRISREHTAKRNFQYSAHSKSQSKSESSTTKGSTIPQISEEKKREFHRKMEEARKTQLLGIEKRKKDEKCLYEQKCDRLFKNLGEDSTAIHANSLERQSTGSKSGSSDETRKQFTGNGKAQLLFDDIPWPHGPGLGIDGVEEFLFSGLDKNTAEYRVCLKKQQVRWHPDRFLHRCGTRLNGSHKTRILSKVKEISQLLNKLSQDLNKK